MLLAIDTSTSSIGIAVYDGSTILGETTWVSTNRHTTILAKAVKQMLEDLEIDQSGLKGIACALGPGSFTSLRVGLSFAKGMAVGLGIPVIGIPTFDILASAQPVNDFPLYVLLQAGRTRLAACLYRQEKGRWISDSEITVHTAESLAEFIQEPANVAGEINADARAFFRKQNKNMKLASPAMCLRRPGFLAELAWKQLEKGSIAPAADLAPIYLHTKDPMIHESNEKPTISDPQDDSGRYL